MLSDRQTRFREQYNERVTQLQSKIDLLPDESRSLLQALLDERDQQCRQLQETAQHTCSLADDLSLVATHTAFHYEATWREVKERCQTAESSSK